MPVIDSSRKALRRDRRRTEINKPIRSRMKRLIREAQSEPNKENLSLAHSAIDRAAKKKVIHKNAASRLKSGLAKVGR